MIEANNDLTDETPSRDFGRLTAENFLSLQRIDLSFSEITAIIGPQASGKSIVAKLVYFFRACYEDYIQMSIAAGMPKSTFEKLQKDKFEDLFQISRRSNKPFRVEYSANGWSISASRDAKARTWKLDTRDLTKFGRPLREQLKQFQKKHQNYKRAIHGLEFYDALANSKEMERIYFKAPRTLFVPAARSYYETFKSGVFDILRRQEAIDPVLVQFGSFYETMKTRYNARLEKNESKRARKFKEKARPIIDGILSRRKDDDFIATDWGEVLLQNASSGQQEGLALLMALAYFPAERLGDQLLIIEEPEAHLYPDAQKRAIDYCVEVARETGCQLLLTTHSPYILACLNIHLTRSNQVEKSRYINGYLLEKGTASPLYDDEADLIDYGALDSVSQMLAEEFAEAVEETSSVHR